MSGTLAGRRAIVTGGARGIGAAVVEDFVAEGARVTLLDRDAGEAAAVAARLGADRVTATECDVRVEQEVARSVGAAAAAYDGLDVLVNNAGVNAYFDAAQMTEQDWDGVFAVDLKAAWLCAKHALPHLRRSGHGAVVNVSSIHARLTTPGMFPYAAAKAGLEGLTRSLALDEGRHGVRVNAVAPGFTRTRLVEEWLARQPDPAAAERAVLDQHALGRMATPAEVAAAVTFLAGDRGGAVTGAVLAVDGGHSVRFAS